MEIEKIIDEEGKCIYHIKGRVDTQTSPELQEKLDESFEKNEANNLIMDFQDVDYLSSAGLRTVLYAQKKINTIEGGTMKVINVQPQVMEVFDMTGFNDLINIEHQ